MTGSDLAIEDHAPQWGDIGTSTSCMRSTWKLADLGRPTKADLLKAMEGHVIASAELVGTYEKKG